MQGTQSSGVQRDLGLLTVGGGEADGFRGSKPQSHLHYRLVDSPSLSIRTSSF